MRIFTLIKCIIKDRIEWWKNGRYKNLFSVFMFVGDVGQGKTLSMVNHIKELQREDERIRVYTNFHYEGQHGAIDHWRDMLEVPSYSIIAIDEVQNTFDQRSWNSFPPQIVQLLTQNRKWGTDNNGGEQRPPGVRILFSTQDYENTDVMIRRLCNKVVQCSAFFAGRLIFNTEYKRREFEKVEEKREIIDRSFFVGTDELRNSYDTYKILKTLKDEENNNNPVKPSVNKGQGVVKKIK